jgi:hypothetical protein
MLRLLNRKADEERKKKVMEYSGVTKNSKKT